MPPVINAVPPGEPGGPSCNWLYLYAANVAEFITAMNQLASNCVVIWLTGTDYIFDTNAITPGASLYSLVSKNLWIIREETQTTAATIKMGPSVTVFPRLFYVDLNSQLTLINVNIENFGPARNTPGAPRGGAIYNDNFVRLYRTTFSNNRGEDGAAVGNVGNLKVWNSSFNNNQANYGGAISNVKFTDNPSQVGIMTASCTTFQNNYAEYGGAVIGLPGGASTTINNSNFIGNDNVDDLSRAIFNSSTNPQAIAASNWWGSPSGSSGGQTVSGPANTTNPLPALVDINGAGCPRPAELIIPPPSSIATNTVVFDPARFDTQLGTLRSQLDGFSGGLSDSSIEPFRVNMLAACNQIAPGQQRVFCNIHASILMILKYKQSDTGSSTFDHQFFVELLVFGEYGGNIRGFTNHTYNSPSPVRQWVWSDEAVARQLYAACGVNGCQGDELYDFLEYFQHPRNGYFFVDYEKLSRTKAEATIPANTYYINQISALSLSVQAILSPPVDSPSWILGVTPDTQPYGYGTDIKVAPGGLGQRTLCNPEGFAYIVANRNGGLVDIFFGTTINSSGNESCNAIFNP